MKRIFLMISLIYLTDFSACSQDSLNGMWAVKMDEINFGRARNRHCYLAAPEYSEIYIKDSLVYVRKTKGYFDNQENELIGKKRFKKDSIQRGRTLILRGPRVRRIQYTTDDWDLIPAKLIKVDNNKLWIIYFTEPKAESYLGIYKDGKIYHSTKRKVVWTSRVLGRPLCRDRYKCKWMLIKVNDKTYDPKTKELINTINK